MIIFSSDLATGTIQSCPGCNWFGLPRKVTGFLYKGDWIFVYREVSHDAYIRRVRVPNYTYVVVIKNSDLTPGVINASPKGEGILIYNNPNVTNEQIQNIWDKIKGLRTGSAIPTNIKDAGSTTTLEWSAGRELRDAKGKVTGWDRRRKPPDNQSPQQYIVTNVRIPPPTIKWELK